MPELPEVETTRLGLLPRLQGQGIADVIVRDRRLRWPIPAGLRQKLIGQTVRDISRRGKYLLFDVDSGFVLVHLGMSGSLQVQDKAMPPAKHDHVDWLLSDGAVMRYTDPRRFGCMLWIAGRTPKHALLETLGPEPFSGDFHGAYLYAASRGRSVDIKQFLMNSHVVVGVGNIYASESLFRAGINPKCAAGKLSRARYEKLADAVRDTLQKALNAGGSSLRDYVRVNGDPGFFQFDAFVYERADLPCRTCKTPIRQFRQGQRSTYYCPTCQK